jgi:hypothetical protein
MDFFRAICILYVFHAAAIAEIPAPLEKSEVENLSAKDSALDRLLSERESSSAFQAAIEHAKKAGVTPQAILEARFLYHVDLQEDAAIAELLPDFIQQRELFKIEDSAIFSVKEDWLAVNEYVQAIAALKGGDKNSFKTHITEAFWLSPKQASAFAPHIDRMRLEEAMRDVKVDFEMKLLTVSSGDAVTLRTLMTDKKAMLFHFWSPASRECVASLPDYVMTAKALSAKGIAMVSILPENSPTILTEARALLTPLGPEVPGAWLIDHPENSIARDLRVQTMPLFALVSSEGHVLFNGDPTEDSLWDTLKKINPEISRPEMSGASE